MEAFFLSFFDSVIAFISYKNNKVVCEAFMHFSRLFARICSSLS